jgi:hypothetical protein
MPPATVGTHGQAVQVGAPAGPAGDDSADHLVVLDGQQRRVRVHLGEGHAGVALLSVAENAGPILDPDTGRLLIDLGLLASLDLLSAIADDALGSAAADACGGVADPSYTRPARVDARQLLPSG